MKLILLNYKAMLRVFLLTGLIVGTSCQDLLELKPQTGVAEEDAFNSPDAIALAVAGMYDAAQSGFYAGGAVRGYPFGAAHVEQGDNRGEDVVNTQAFYAVTYGTTYDPTSANNDFHFQTLFALVNRCNLVLEGLDTAVPQLGLTQANIDAYKGEARFLRALAYHELMVHFCRPYADNPNAAGSGMPIRTFGVRDHLVTAPQAIPVGRSTVAECYTFILGDLDYAESVLPESRTPLNVKISRATKAAAVALKTRVYLHMGNWAMVVTEGDKLASQATAPFTPATGFGSYSLPSNPYIAFSAGGSKSNPESIFSIENSAEDNASVNGALASMYTTSAAPTSGRALVAISPLIWTQPWFLATDVRKSGTFVSFDEAPTGGGKGGYFSKKYTDVTGRSDNAPVMRYAEVLLSVAEAIQRQTGTVDARAFQMFNAVRSRSNAAGTDASYDDIGDFATADALIQAIHNERRIEFLCEGLRWGDIHRLALDPTFNSWGGGIPLKVSQNITNYRPYYSMTKAAFDAAMLVTANRHAAFPYSNFRFIWPIPTSELVLNPTLAGQQNPGY